MTATILSALENQITEAVERLTESVVSIDSVRVTRDFRYGLVPIEGKGSGLIIDRNGYVITNNHVIDGATRVQVHLKDGKKLKVGQIALAIGNTLGLQGGPTVSMGVVSALGRPLPGTDFIFEGLIQTDTAINPGNSGGPLADIGGNMIGMNTAMIPFAQGVGFAIPVNTIKWVVQQILEKGRVVRPWLGISGANMNQAIARRYDLPADSGVLVVEVDTRGPAYDAGMRVGDVIIQVGSHAVKQMKDVLMALSKLAIKEEVEVDFIRLNAKRKALLRLKESPIAVTASRER